MKNTITPSVVTPSSTKSVQIAHEVFETVARKGTCFAGFLHNGKTRNVTLGSDLSDQVVGAGSWGTSYARASLVEHKGRLYIQGRENNTGEAISPIKRFDIDKISAFRVG